MMLCTMLSAQASYVNYSYNGMTCPAGYYGNNVSQTYDVAIRLDAPEMVGARISGVSVELPEIGIANVSVWLSSELRLKKVNGRGVNDPDICSLAATVKDNLLNFEFDTSYLVPADGIYVGYSFTVETLDETNSSPISVADGSDAKGFYLHTSRTKTQWGSLTSATGKVSALTVKLEGDFAERAAMIQCPMSETFPDEGSTMSVSLQNKGIQNIESLELSYEVNGIANSATIKCDPPVRFLHQYDNTGKIDLPAIAEAGFYPVSIHVSKINGEEVDGTEYGSTMTVYPFKPVSRPLVEEYTGLWCGYCPKGYMALETMKKEYGNLFVAAAYHYNDPMAFTGTMPNDITSYPAAVVNRNLSIKIEDLPRQWDIIREFIADADIDIKAEWVDAEKDAINISSTLKFIKDSEKADYRVSYLLVADSLSNQAWLQHNSFAGGTIEEYPYMDNEIGRIFLDGPKYVAGLVFNDVTLLASDIDDTSSRLETNITAETAYTHSYTFSLKGLDKDLIIRPGNLRVIGILTKGAKKKFVNCNSSRWMNGDSFVPDVSSVYGMDDVQKQEIARYSIDGQKLGEGAKGMQIILYSDGSVMKVIR